MPRATARLLQRFAHAKVFFEALPTREIVQGLVAEEADVAISSAPLDHPVLEVRAIGQWTLLCAVPKGHELVGRKFDLAKALKQRVVGYSPEAPQSRVIDAWFETLGIARQVAVEVRSGYAACAMAAGGAGVAFVDDLSARAYRSDDLELIRIPNAPKFAIYSVTNVNRPLSQLGQTFLKSAKQELQVLLEP